MVTVLAINGSYREGGITDQTLKSLTQALEAAGAAVESVVLRDSPLQFCRNCRTCTQQPGTFPGECVQQDGMRELIAQIERADCYIFAAPTNMGAVTALFKRFMERLAVYAYWPWDRDRPQSRKAQAPKKKALLVSSCAAPGIIGRWFFGTDTQLKLTAEMIGAEVVGTIFTGRISKQQRPKLPEGVSAKTRKLADRLVRM